MNFSEYKKVALETDHELKTEYDALDLRFRIIKEVIKARNEKSMTQLQLAKKMQTRQSNISRLESGNYNPSLAFLQRVAQALDKDLFIYMK